MKYCPREIEKQLIRASRAFPAVVLTGPRRAGKTLLLRRQFPGAEYYLLEDPDLLARVKEDPHGFLDGLRCPVILDEIQNAPELFSLVRTRIDRNPRRLGQWFLTGSQESALMGGVTESMAGRAAILHLFPFSVRESSKVSLIRGGYPEVLGRPSAASLWFSSYLQTYLERDVRAVTAVRDLSTFRRFLALLAARHGQALNKTAFAAPLGVSVPTITQWLSVLEVTAQILLIPPFYENFGKRLVKAPKLYVADSGLACHLLGIESNAELERSPFKGALFEGFIAGEILKSQLNQGKRRELYYFRDEQGLEVDFLIPRKGGELWLLESKASRTPIPKMAESMKKLQLSMNQRRNQKSISRCWLIHNPTPSSNQTTALSPGVKAMAWERFCREEL